ncbi:receptor like protein kinase S.2-like [Rutidosis leptorrhynchoides]|uniref:receptor like protein kinase S.2-like n=1 Tax=Rutidosis leptorrhynchoides TaxID=125765 RepID=UPI003A99BF82
MASSSIDTYHEDVASITIPYDEIATATNNFADENLISVGRTNGIKHYKGQLSESGQLINIVAARYPLRNAAIRELPMISITNHKNINSVFKYSDTGDGGDNSIITKKHVANGSLNKYLGDSQTLTWMQRLHICVGVAHALGYLHNDILRVYDKTIIHGNIKSSKILLDDNWEPKLSGFGDFWIVKRGDDHIPSEHLGNSGYRDPAYNNNHSLSHKSDVFSFGVVLFELLFGREASTYDTPPNEDDTWYFSRLARQHHEEKRLDDRIDPDLRRQMDLKSLNLFTETAYRCIKEKRAERPDIDQVVSKLEKALQLQQKHDPTQEPATAIESRISRHLKGINVDHLKIRLSDIHSATQNFSQICKIGSGAYGAVYKAELNHFDVTNSSAIEPKNDGEFPRAHSTVAIKRISRREDKQGKQGFLREIQLLSNCNHPNVVSLLGYCDDDPEMILIYEYASNGSLDSYFGNPDNLINLSWARRIQISIDIAQGLSYLHTSTEEKETIIHRDIKSANVLLDGNWRAKIADFGLSKLRDANQQGSTLVTKHIAGTDLYLDPEYIKPGGKLKKASDIYSFGVVLFELLCGRLAYDKIYNDNDQTGLPSIVRGQPFDMERLKNLMDPRITESDASIIHKIGGVDQESLETFIRIAYKCLAETQAQRPLMGDIIKELKKSLESQKNGKDKFQMSFNEIQLATKHFSENNCVGTGRFWKQYEGELPDDNGCKTIIVKRWDRKSDPKHLPEFWTELGILFKYKHECIIGLAGYCNEMDEKIIVYEHGYNERLSKHLDNASLTWMKRLKIAIDVATGLDFLHTDGARNKYLMMHRDIKSACILLNSDFKAKISNLELCVQVWQHEKVEQSSSDHAYSSLGYMEPGANGVLTRKSDIYSLGAVLLELLGGSLLSREVWEDYSLSPVNVLTRYNDVRRIFEGIKGQIDPNSLVNFTTIALQCLNTNPDNRPLANEVVVELKRLLEYQEGVEIWKPKLPIDYKEIIEITGTPDIFEGKTWKELYQMFHQGIPLIEGKLGIIIQKRIFHWIVVTHSETNYNVAFGTPLAPYEKSKFLGFRGSMVARLKLKGIDERAPPGVDLAA